MNRLAIAALAVFLFVLAFGYGLAVNFPQEAATRAIEASINTSPFVAVSLAPVRLTLTGLRSDSLVVREAGVSTGLPLFTLKDVRMPFRPALLRGAPLRAQLGAAGQVSGFVAWDGSEITLDELSARLEDLPLPLAPGMTLQGRITLSGHLAPAPVRAGARPELPEGELRARLEGVEVKGLKVAGAALPVTRLQDVEILIRTGRTVQIERLEAHGDLQGTVQGSIVPNLERLQESRLSLTLAASMRPGWIQETGTLRPILEGFFPGGRIDGAVSGTAGAPSWVPKGGRR